MTPTRRITIGMLIAYAVTGVLEPHVQKIGGPLSPTGMALLMIMAVLLFAWCKADAAERKVQAPAGAPLLVGLIAIVGIPYYFLKTLPLKPALLATGRAALFYVVLIGVFTVCMLISSMFV